MMDEQHAHDLLAAYVLDAVPEGVGPRLLSTATPRPNGVELEQELVDRVGVSRVVIPPLRHRPEDVPVLATEFARRFAPRRPPPRFAPEAL